MRSALFRDIQSRRAAVQEDAAQQKVHEFLGERIVVQENSNSGVAGSLWEAYMLVLNDIADRVNGEGRNAFEGQKVLELGAGTGLASLLLARLGADVTITDLHHALDLIRLNVKLNEKAHKHPVSVKEHSWGEDVGDLGGPFDILVASECIYNLKYGPQLLTSMLALSKPGTRVLFAYATRHAEEEAKFLEDVAQKFTVHEVKKDDSVPDRILNMLHLVRQ